jgi:hypothetical protein
MVKGGSMFCRAAFLPNEYRRIFGELEKEDFLPDADTLLTLARQHSQWMASLY